MVSKDLSRIIMSRKDEVGLQLRGILQIEVADAADAASIHDISRARLQHALKGDQPHQKEGGNHDQTEHKKGRSQVGDLSNQGESNQATRYSPNKETGTAIGF